MGNKKKFGRKEGEIEVSKYEVQEKLQAVYKTLEPLSVKYLKANNFDKVFAEFYTRIYTPSEYKQEIKEWGKFLKKLGLKITDKTKDKKRMKLEPIIQDLRVSIVSTGGVDLLKVALQTENNSDQIHETLTETD